MVQALVKEHGKAYEEMRSYFNDITANTLDLIKALKADAAELKRRETAAEALAFELAQENKRLIDPLALVSGVELSRPWSTPLLGSLLV